METQIVIYAIAGLITLLLIVGSIVIIPEKSTVVIQRFGKFNRVLRSGFNLKIPIVEGKAGVINMRVQQMDIAVETKTKDNVFVDLKVSVQYIVLREKVREAFYSLDDPVGQIASYVFDDVRAEVPKMELDDVFSRKDDIADAVRTNLSNSMEEYGYQIVKTLITDINPDQLVKQSMNRINAAKRDKDAMLEEAEAEKIKTIKNAEAEAESKRLQGEGIAKQRLEIVRGFKESVEDFQKSLKDVTHEEVMQFVLMTQYFDTLNSIGADSKNTTLMMPHSPGGMKDFQQQIITGTIVGSHVGSASQGDDDQPTHNLSKSA
jgi:regulator of protease activity HflC (stomatin/prohibitin superfamily)